MHIYARKWNGQAPLRSIWTVTLLAPLLILAACAGNGLGTAQSSAQKSAGVRIYVFDCGRLKSANPQLLLARGVTVTDMSVAAYLIVHPRGTLLWDTCVIPDELIKPEGTTVARATARKTLRDQLAEIG